MKPQFDLSAENTALGMWRSQPTSASVGCGFHISYEKSVGCGCRCGFVAQTKFVSISYYNYCDL